MDKICDYNECSGCACCVAVCPKKCIKLLPDNNRCGHIYPVIDNSICINCRLCEKTCPVNHSTHFSNPKKAFAAYALDDVVCNNSSSGGLAYSLGRAIVETGGVVYGSIVEFGVNFSIHHDNCSDLIELKRTQGSKYVHSEVKRVIYEHIKQNLVNGNKVLFVGTGCEVNGVRNYLRKDYPNFYAIDIICHGVPSFQLLKDYLSHKYDITEIKKLSFRGKNGFDLDGVYGVRGIRIYKPLKNNLYMMGFMKGLYYRDACYSCHYARKERCGDLSLGDFWGLKKSISPENRTSSGTSVVLVNTTKGEELLNSVRAHLRIEERPIEEAVAGNPQLRCPSKRHYASNLFRKLYPSIGFISAARLCLIREKIFYAYALPIIQKLRK